jgi:hypothetical protein
MIFFSPIQLPEQYGPVRMLSQGKGNMVLVGTTKNCILQGTIDFKFSPIVQVHTHLYHTILMHYSHNGLITINDAKSSNKPVTTLYNNNNICTCYIDWYVIYFKHLFAIMDRKGSQTKRISAVLIMILIDRMCTKIIMNIMLFCLTINYNFLVPK